MLCILHQSPQMEESVSYISLTRRLDERLGGGYFLMGVLSLVMRIMTHCAWKLATISQMMLAVRTNDVGPLTVAMPVHESLSRGIATVFDK